MSQYRLRQQMDRRIRLEVDLMTHPLTRVVLTAILRYPPAVDDRRRFTGGAAAQKKFSEV